MILTLTFVLFATQLADWYSTRTILARRGVEKNPIAAKLMDVFGIDGFLGAKTIGVTALGYWIGTQNIYLLAAVICVYFIVVLYNWWSM